MKMPIIFLIIFVSVLHAAVGSGFVHVIFPQGNVYDSVSLKMVHLEGRFKANIKVAAADSSGVLLPAGLWGIESCVLKTQNAHASEYLKCSNMGVYVGLGALSKLSLTPSSSDTLSVPSISNCSANIKILTATITGSHFQAKSSWNLAADAVQIILPAASSDFTPVFDWQVQCGSEFRNLGILTAEMLSSATIDFASVGYVPSPLQLASPNNPATSCDGFHGLGQSHASLITTRNLTEWGDQAQGELWRWISNGPCTSFYSSSLFRTWNYSGQPLLPDLGSEVRYPNPSRVQGLAQKKLRRSLTSHHGRFADGSEWFDQVSSDTSIFSVSREVVGPIKAWFHDILIWPDVSANDSIIASFIRSNSNLNPSQADTVGSAYLGVTLDIVNMDTALSVQYSGDIERPGKQFSSFNVGFNGKGRSFPVTIPIYLPAGEVNSWINLEQPYGSLSIKVPTQNLQNGDSLVIDAGMEDEWSWNLPSGGICLEPGDSLPVNLKFVTTEPIESIHFSTNGQKLFDKRVMGKNSVDVATKLPTPSNEGAIAVRAVVALRSGRQSSQTRWYNLDDSGPDIQWVTPMAKVLNSPDSIWILSGSVSDIGSDLSSVFFTDEIARTLGTTISDTLIVNTVSGSRILTAIDKCGFVRKDTLSFTVNDAAPIAQMNSCDSIRSWVQAGGDFTLSATGSSDPDDYIKHFRWTFNNRSIGFDSSFTWEPDEGAGTLMLQVSDRYDLSDTAQCFINAIRKGYRAVCGKATPDTCGVCEVPTSTESCKDFTRRLASGPEWELVDFSSKDTLLTIRLQTCVLASFEDDQILYLNTDSNLLTGQQGMDWIVLWDYFRQGDSDPLKILASRWDSVSKNWTTPVPINYSIFSQDAVTTSANLTIDLPIGTEISSLSWSMEGGRYLLGSRLYPKTATGINQ